MRRMVTRASASGYVLFVILPLAAMIAILRYGQSLPPATGAAPNTAPVSVTEEMARLQLPLFLLQIVVIIATARLVGAALRRVGQPQVVGEMLAGLLLGASFLGLIFPQAYGWLFPYGTGRFLNAVSQIGLVLFMFLMGLELNPRDLLSQGRNIVVTAHASMAVPMLAGVGLAVYLFPRYAVEGTSFSIFALFIGCAFSITAFPVLARILSAQRLIATPFGRMAMATAAIVDASAWLILAFVVALARGGHEIARQSMGRVLVMLAAYVLVMLLAVRPGLTWLWKRRTRRAGRHAAGLTEDDLSVAIIVVLLSAVATEYLHVHALFGAFLAGLAMPPDAHVRGEVSRKFEDLLTILFLPIFFARAGIRVDLAHTGANGGWLACAAIIAVAVAGKLGGTLLASRYMGASWRDAGALGTLMNARGLMELVLLTIGLQIGVITNELYGLMVLMALVTTMMTVPLLARISGPRLRAPGESRQPVVSSSTAAS